MSGFSLRHVGIVGAFSDMVSSGDDGGDGEVFCCLNFVLFFINTFTPMRKNTSGRPDVVLTGLFFCDYRKI